MKKWLKNRILNAETEREKLDVIVAVLKEDYNYAHDDFYFDEVSKILVIRNVVIVAWNSSDDMYSFSIAVNTEPYGLAVLINGLHLSGVHNINIYQEFYIPDKPIVTGDVVQMFFNKEAIDQYQKELKSIVKNEMLYDLVQTRILLDDNSCSKTIH